MVRSNNSKTSTHAVLEGRSFLERMETGVWGLGIGVLGVLMLLSQVSYVLRHADGSPDSGTNLIGPVGAYLSLHVYYLFGIAGTLLALAAVLFGALLIAQRLIVLRREHLIGAGVIVLPAAILLHFVTPESTSLPQGWGGILGKALGDWLLAHLIGRAGAWVLCVAAIIAGVSTIFRVHVKSFFLVPWFFLRGLVGLLLAGRGDSDDEDETEASLARLDADRETDDPTRPSGSAASRARVVRPDEDATSPARPDKPAAPPEPADAPPDPAPEPSAVAALLPLADDAPPPPDSDAQTDEATTPADVTRPSRAIVRQDPSQPADEEYGDDDESPPAPDAGGDDGKEGHIPAAGRIRRARPKRSFETPDVGTLDYHATTGHKVDDSQLHDSAHKLQEKLEDFKIEGQVGDIHPGPVIALYEFKPGRGVKLSTISNLSKDIAMALAAEQVRILAPIPGRDVVGFEIPNKVREMVYLRELLSNPIYRQGKHKLPLVLGKDIAGNPTITDLAKMPHLLVAGTTGSGKSVAIHSFIMSILFKRTPDEVRFIFVDPKMLELTSYAEIPHLLVPVVTESKDAAVALRGAVTEMERRNRLMSSVGVPNITEYNQYVRRQKGKEGAEELEELPYIVVVIDELADLMMVAGKQVETSIARLAQMARAAGMHMIIATQNPTIKVVTGIIKANLPSRIAFKVRTMQDSRVILDQNGADDLLGYGDMLFLGPGSSKLNRIHGAFVSTEERNRVVDFLKAQGEPDYNVQFMKTMEEDADDDDLPGLSGGSERDETYATAVAIAVARGKISTSALQRELGIGYNKAAVLMSRMEKEGIVGPPEAAGKPRVVLRSR